VLLGEIGCVKQRRFEKERGTLGDELLAGFSFAQASL